VPPRGRSDVAPLFRFLSQIIIKQFLFPSQYTRDLPFVLSDTVLPTKSHRCPRRIRREAPYSGAFPSKRAENGCPKRGLRRIQAGHGPGLLCRWDLVRLHHPRRSTRDLVNFFYYVFYLCISNPLVKLILLQLFLSVTCISVKFMF
jgi:hypothetical protein